MNDRPPRRCRQLALLTVLVLAVHLLLLQSGGTLLAPTPDSPTQHFTTRTVAIAPPAPAPAPAAPAAPELARLAPRAAAARVPARASEAPAAPAASGEAIPHAGAAPARPASPLPSGVAPLAPSVLRYEVTVHTRGFTLGGQARLDWRHDGQRYEARLEVNAGQRQRVQQSTGTITAAGLVPERFSDKSRAEQATHFDHAGGRVVFSNNRPEAPLVAGMQDRLSVVLQLAMLVAGEPARFAAGTQVALPTASTREAEAWLFRVIGEEDLELPGGPLRALKLERLPRKEFDQKVELWLAPGQDYAPVRLRLTNPDGGWVDQRWASTDRG
jgi:hypothetical protein